MIPLARGRILDATRPIVMGILNVTPDSFSDGGRVAPDTIAAAANAMVAQGADLLDVGGESTRPGHRPVPAAEELARVLPALHALADARIAVPVSIDTSKAAVAQQALDAGAAMVNDVRALGDPGMGRVVRDAGCAVVLMRHEPLQGAPLAACRQQWQALLGRAEAQGVPPSSVVLDPGVGFGDPPGGDVAANMALLQCGLLGFPNPVLVGASRKRFIATMTGEDRPDRRVGGSVAAAVLAVQAGAHIVRVHDVAETVQALRVLRHASAAR